MEFDVWKMETFIFLSICGFLHRYINCGKFCSLQCIFIKLITMSKNWKSLLHFFYLVLKPLDCLACTFWIFWHRYLYFSTFYMNSANNWKIFTKHKKKKTFLCLGKFSFRFFPFYLGFMALQNRITFWQ